MHTYLCTQTLSPRSELRLLRAAILLLATLELSAPFFLMNLDPIHHFHTTVHCESNLKLLLEIEPMKCLSFTYVYIDLYIYI